MKLKLLSAMILFLISSSLSSCDQELSCHDEMTLIQEKYNNQQYNYDQGHQQEKIPYSESLLIAMQSIQGESNFCKCLKANMLMKLGQKEKAIEALKGVPRNYKVEMVKTKTE